MSPAHSALAIVVATIWGIAFVVSKCALESFTPAQLTALRFLVAGAAVTWVPRPSVPWWALLGVGLTTFTGQFLLQFFGLVNGMPAGLTAFVVQTQAVFTVLIAATVLGDKPTSKQVAGMTIALVGIALIGSALGGGTAPLGFALTLASALSWALGNVLVKSLPRTDMLSLMVWASLVPPIPALAISMSTDGPTALFSAVENASFLSLAAPVYLGLVASLFAYTVWGKLLQRYSAGAVAPFALLAPCVGAVASALLLGETFDATRLFGMMLILVGVAVCVLPQRRQGP